MTKDDIAQGLRICGKSCAYGKREENNNEAGN